MELVGLPRARNGIPMADSAAYTYLALFGTSCLIQPKIEQTARKWCEGDMFRYEAVLFGLFSTVHG